MLINKDVAIHINELYDDTTLTTERMNKIFPHYSRKFSASLGRAIPSASVWIVTLSFFVINMYTYRNAGGLYVGQVQSFMYPAQAQYHKTLSNTYKKLGLLVSSARERQFAKFLSAPTTASYEQVLGAQIQNPQASPPLSTLQQTWEAVVQDKPDYRDAFLMLGNIALQQKRITQARAYAEHAFLLDPNFHYTAELIKEIESAKL